MFVRAPHNSNYKPIDRGFTVDKRLPLAARGLFAAILQLPDDWKFSIMGLAALTGASHGQIERAVSKLEEFGYIERRRGERTKGRFTDGEWVIFEQGNHNPETGIWPQAGQTSKDACSEPQPRNGDMAASRENIKSSQVKPQPRFQDPIMSDYKVSTQNRDLQTMEEQNHDPPFWKQCLDALNDELSKAFPSMPEFSKQMLEQYRDSYSLEDVRAMVRFKAKEWKGTKIASNLTPKTLFKPEHFETYMQQAMAASKEAEEYAIYDRPKIEPQESDHLEYPNCPTCGEPLTLSKTSNDWECIDCWVAYQQDRETGELEFVKELQ